MKRVTFEVVLVKQDADNVACMLDALESLLKGSVGIPAVNDEPLVKVEDV